MNPHIEDMRRSRDRIIFNINIKTIFHMYGHVKDGLYIETGLRLLSLMNRQMFVLKH